MSFCDLLCSMPKEVLLKIFVNLKMEIDSLLEIYA